MSSRVILGAGLCVALVGSSASAQDIWGTRTSEEKAASPASTPAPRSAVTAAPAIGTTTATTPEAPQASAPAAPAVKAPELDPNGSYSERVLAGLRQVVLRDFDGAIGTLRGAAQLEPSNPSAFCHLGDAQLGKADWAEAKAAYDTCARFSALARDARNATLSAVGLARVAELSQQSLVERRDAYVRLEAGTSDTAAKTMAAARLAALDTLIALDTDYVEVRKRIAEREAAAAKPK